MRGLLVVGLLVAAAASPAAQEAAPQDPRLFGFLRVAGDLGEEGPDDVAGYELLGARLALAGTVDGVRYFLSAEGFTSTLRLLDAFARVPLGNDVGFTMGTFRTPALSGALTPLDRTLFPRRTQQGVIWARRQLGAQVDGPLGRGLHWFLAMHDGSDGDAQGVLAAARLRWQVVGEQLAGQGGHAPEDDPTAAVSLAFVSETEVSGATAVLSDVVATRGRWYVHAELGDYADGFVAGAVPAGNATGAQGLADATPWALSVAYATDHAVELVARHEEFDDLDASRRTTVGLNHRRGASALLSLVWSSLASDDASREVDRLELGLTLRF